MQRRCIHAAALLLGALLSWNAQADLDARQTRLLINNCMQCHARAGIGVPLMGHAADWVERNRQGEEKLLANVIHGLRGMPPLGYCSACNEDDLRALIRAMSGISEAKK